MRAIATTALAASLFAAVASAPPTARADDVWPSAVPARARTLADRGRKLHDAGDYRSAIAAFTQAYAMAPSPALLFNLAQAYRLGGNCDDAAVLYRRYLASNPPAEGRALAEGHLATVERCMHKLALHIPVETPSGALVVPPPPAVVASDVAPPASHTAQIEKDVGIGLFTGGSIALAAAVYYAFQAHNASNDVAAAYAMGAKWKEVAPIDQRGKDASTRAQISGGAAALGIAGGVAMYLLGRHTEQTPVTVAATGHGVQVSMLWAF